MTDAELVARLTRIETLQSQILQRLDAEPKQATYLTTAQTVAYLQFASVDALYVWVSRQRIPKCRRGRTVLFLKRDLDEAVAPPRVEPDRRKRDRA